MLMLRRLTLLKHLMPYQFIACTHTGYKCMALSQSFQSLVHLMLHIWKKKHGFESEFSKPCSSDAPHLEKKKDLRELNVRFNI